MLKRQTLQCQHCLHACVMENLSSTHSCTPLPSVAQQLSWWFNGFSAVSMVSSFEVDNDMILLALGENPPPKKKKRLYAALCLTDAVRSIKVKRGKSYTQLIDVIHPVRNGMVLSLAVSTHTLGPFHSKREWAGCWQWKFSRSLFCLLSNTGNDLV